MQTYVVNSSINVSGALTIDATATESIDAIVIAGTAAVSGGGTTGVGVSAAGVYAENKIKNHVKSYIDGDGDTGITAGSAALRATDSAGISAIAGAASLAGSVGGTTGVSVAIGLSLAFNEISSEVESYIINADQGVTTTAGGPADDIIVSATSAGGNPFDLDLAAQGLTFADLDDVAKADQDDPETGTDEARDDADSDADILTDIAAAFAARRRSRRP